MASTVGETTTNRTTTTRTAERETNRGLYWAIGLALVVVLGIILARNYAGQRTVVPTTPVESSQTAPMNNGVASPSYTTPVESSTGPAHSTDTPTPPAANGP